MSGQAVGGAGRLASLDAFRGITIVAMLVVNNPGSWATVYAPLLHAPWHGWTPTDLIFPFFLFIVGVSMVFSIGAQLARGASRRALLARAIRRGLIIIALGLLLHGFPDYLDLSTLRIPGVLQRIGLAYLAAAPIMLWLGRRERGIIVALLLLGYCALQTLVRIPGGGVSRLEPGADLGAWIDRTLFGTAHLWSQSQTWDPEGLLSTMPAIATLLLGTWAGEWLRNDRAGSVKTAGLVGAGAVGVGIGLLWSAALPINKSLWTSSFVLFTAGTACLVLAGCYWLMDVRHRRTWAKPFMIFGTNAIAAFFLSSLGARLLGMIQTGTPAVSLKARLHHTLFASWLPPFDASLAFALAYTLFWLAVMAVLYHRRIFIRV